MHQCYKKNLANRAKEVLFSHDTARFTACWEVSAELLYRVTSLIVLLTRIWRSGLVSKVLVAKVTSCLSDDFCSCNFFIIASEILYRSRACRRLCANVHFY